ncbi:MAG: hypothetical protein M0Z51_16765 [Propionibacterium sp.]|nr:hypothetical protein [Propionibacterium sp.]
MSLNVGELIAYLRMDMRTFEDGAARAQTMADKLDGKTVDVKVKADTAVAEEKLAAVAASEDKVDEGNKKIAKSGQDAGGGMGALVAAVLLLGPALVPIAAGTAGLAVGLSAMGAAGVLAIVGIRQEMAAGTALGETYREMIVTLKGDLTTLGATASRGVLGPFQQSVADLQTKLPALNGLIGDFSVITGKTAGVLTTGLVAAFLALAPLARDAGAYVLGLSNRFAALMSGPGVVTFGDYVRSVFPQVMQAVESIVGAVFHLVAAIAPLGLGSLSILRMLTDVINAIPTDHLAQLVQIASAVYIGFEAFKLLSGPLGDLSTKLVGIGVSAEAAATGVRALTIASGVIGAIIGVATLIYSANADSVRANTQAANDYADALRKSNGIIDENIRQMTAKNLSDSGALAAARQLGLSLSMITDAALGQGDALAKVTAIAKPFHDAMIASEQGAGASSEAITKNGHAADTLTAALGDQNAELQSGVQKYKDLTAATTSSTAALTPAGVAQAALAARIGTTSAALVLATAGQNTTAEAMANAAAKMYMENDAAGILKTSLDLLNGKAISAADAQNSFDSALVNMGDHLTATGTKVHFTTTSIDDMSSASVALRGQLNAQVTNLQNVVEANGGLSESTGKAREQMVTMRQQIIDNAAAHGVDRDAVTAYIDKLLAIPATVPPTKLDVESADAQAKVFNFQQAISAIPRSLAVTITANTASNLASTYLSQVPGHAGGGLLSGPGTGTSDSILGVNASGVPVTYVSAGEYVVNAAATARNRPQLDAINSGRPTAGAGNGSISVVRLHPDDIAAIGAATVAAANVTAGATLAGAFRSADNSRMTQGRVH